MAQKSTAEEIRDISVKLGVLASQSADHQKTLSDILTEARKTNGRVTDTEKDLVLVVKPRLRVLSAVVAGLCLVLLLVSITGVSAGEALVAVTLGGAGR